MKLAWRMLLRLTITDGTGQARFSSPCSVAASLDPPPPLAGSRVYRGLVLTSSTFPSVQSLKTPDVGLEPPTPELVFHKVMSGGSRQPTVPNQHYSLKSTSGTELYTFDMGIESGMLRSIQCGDAADFAVISTASACVVAAPCVAVTPAVFFAVSPPPSCCRGRRLCQWLRCRLLLRPPPSPTNGSIQVRDRRLLGAETVGGLESVLSQHFPCVTAFRVPGL